LGQPTCFLTQRTHFILIFDEEKVESLEELLKLWTGGLAAAIEGLAACIIAIAALQALAQILRLFLSSERRVTQGIQIEAIRLRFGRWLTLALEFELGADILRTAIAPTWSEIGQLAAIATIRTFLNYFLQKEIERAERSQQQMASQD
jgi:uncharacterized membrane protein